jgi:hypothetical protein
MKTASHLIPFHRCLLVSVVLNCAVISIGVAQGTECQQASIADKAAEVDRVRHSLVAIPVGDGGDNAVSTGASRAILSMKTSLVDFIESYMNCAPQDTTPTLIENDLDRLGHAFQLARNRTYKPGELPADAGHYGFELNFEAKTWPPDLIGIVAQFSITCGNDALLMVFRRIGGRWKPTMEWQSEPYSQVSGAFGSFDYAISPADPSGSEYVLVKSIAPWCSSTWSSIRYTVLRPTPSSLIPRQIFIGANFMWWGNEDYGKLTADQKFFEVRFHSASIDAGIHNRVWIRRFQIDGDAVRRIPPVALSPRDFVDEWITVAWDEASTWTALHQRQSLQSIHEALRAKQTEFDGALKCMGSPDRIQIEVADFADPSQRYFFAVTARENFELAAVSTVSDPKCSGDDILETMATQ